jgi:RNA polymerase sigma-70 factor (ECF subfamily)
MERGTRSSDADLMTRMRSGDQDAFGQLVDRYKDGIVNYLTRLIDSRAQAEEMAQETFLRLYLHRDRYTEQGKLSAFLYRIATNLCRSEHRRRRRQRLLRLAFLGAANGSNGANGANGSGGYNGSNGHAVNRVTPQSMLLKQEAQELLRREICKLPLRFRVPLVLHEIEGLTYQEVARVTGTRENTVKSRISRGRGQLRRKLEPYVTGAGDVSHEG